MVLQATTRSGIPEAGHGFDLAGGIEDEDVGAASPLTSVSHSRDPVGEHRPLTMSDYAIAPNPNAGHETVNGSKMRAEVGHSFDRAEPIAEADVRSHKSSQRRFLATAVSGSDQAANHPSMVRSAFAWSSFEHDIGKQRQLVAPTLLEFVAVVGSAKSCERLRRVAPALLGQMYRDRRTIRWDRSTVTKPYVNTISLRRDEFDHFTGNFSPFWKTNEQPPPGLASIVEPVPHQDAQRSLSVKTETPVQARPESGSCAPADEGGNLDVSWLACLMTTASGTRAASGLLQLRLQLEAPQRIVPHAFEHLTDRSQCFSSGSVETIPPFGSYINESSRREATKLQRHGPERHVGHRLVNGAGPQFLIPDQAENFSPAWRGDGRKNGRFELHDFNLYKTKLLSSADSESRLC